MAVAVGQQRKYLRLHRLCLALVQVVGAVAQAHVALSAVVVALLAEVAQQLAAAAYPVVAGIGCHGLYALDVLSLAVFVDAGRDEKVFTILSAHTVGDGGHLAAGDEVQNMAAVQMRGLTTDETRRKLIDAIEGVFQD